MMKKIATILLLHCVIGIFAQNYSGYYSSIRTVFMDPLYKRVNPIPKDLKYFDDWGKNASYRLFMSDLQNSSGDTSSNKSLDLIFRFDYDFQFLDTGFFLHVNKNKPNRDDRIFVIANDQWKAPLGGINLEDLNPNDNVKNFFYAKYFLNMTDGQVLAHFINSFPNPTDKNVTPLKQFIRDVNKANNIKVPENIEENQGNAINLLCSEINKQMPNSDCSYAGYITYIKQNDDVKTRKKISDFYRNIQRFDVESMINDKLLPNGKIEFPEKNQYITMSLPNTYFYAKSKNDKSNIQFDIDRIEHDLDYDFEKKKYVLNIKVIPRYNSLSSDFLFESNVNSQLTGKRKLTKVPVLKNELNYLKFYLYDDKIEVEIAHKYQNFEMKDMLLKNFPVKIK